MKHTALLAEVRAKLEAVGLKTEVVAEAASGSCYLKFEDQRMGKLRIGDHEERKQYGYRWQIRTDIKLPCVDQQKGHRRFFYPPSHLDQAVIHISNYHDKILAAKKPA